MTPTESKTPAKGIDLAELDTVAASNKGLRIQLLSPKDQSETGIFWTVLGRDSDVFREVVRENVDAANRRAHLARQRGKPLPAQTMEDGENEAIDLLTVCSVGWENMVCDGKALEFNVPNCRMILKRFPWIRKQVDDAIGDLESFLKG